jgi:FdhE protein
LPLTAARSYSYSNLVRRAEILVQTWPSASELLKAYTAIVLFQDSLSQTLRQTAKANDTLKLPEHVDFVPWLPKFGELLDSIAHSSLTNLIEPAKKLQAAGPSYWQNLLEQTWTNPGEAANSETFFALAFLQPIASKFAQGYPGPADSYARPICPYCGRKPVCGVLRPEGDGGKRSLICSFCSTEWEYRRLICPACESEDLERLPVFTDETFTYIRVEACDKCSTFIKTIDLTKDGRAVPVVDEIASLPLTLWAREKGYEKLQQNLLLM